MQEARRRRTIAAAAAIAAAGVVVLASLAIAARPGGPTAGSGPGSAACPTAGEPATHATSRQLRRSVRCLINEERAVRGLAKLARKKSLQKAADRHADAMAETDCLAHRCGDEDDLRTRLRKAGYFRGAKSWRFAENTGCGASAEAMVANWMASRFHRVNILNRKFRDVGVGVTHDRVSGRCDRGFATFAVVHARRLLETR
jgi:uncharacterized protein YkwD